MNSEFFRKTCFLMILKLVTFSSFVLCQRGAQIELKGLADEETVQVVEDSNDDFLTENENTEADPKSILVDVESFEDIKRKLEKLEQQSKDNFYSDVETYELKYRTAITIINNIISDARKLEVLYTTLKIYGDFAKLANPMEYQQFEDSIDDLNSGDFRSGISLPEIDISNPIISTAYSVIGSIFSKNDDRNDSYEKMKCIIELTLNFRADLRSIDNQINYLRISAKNLDVKGQKIYGIFASAIAYQKSYEEYYEDINVKGVDDPMEMNRKLFFNSVKKDAEKLEYNINNAKKVKLLELHFLQVSDYIANYENLLFEGLTYYNTFINILSKYKNSDCSNETQGLTEKFEPIVDELNNVKELYSKAYNGAVTTSDKLKFYFGRKSN